MRWGAAERRMVDLVARGSLANGASSQAWDRALAAAAEAPVNAPCAGAAALGGGTAPSLAGGASATPAAAADAERETETHLTQIFVPSLGA